MTDTTLQPPVAARVSRPWHDPLLALLAALFILSTYALGGFEALSDLEGDNDSLLRLVDIRDLIAGQGWFDLHQYRMGPEGGFVIHWSRLVDAPIAAISLVVTALTGSVAVGETAAAIVWPFFLSALSMFFLIKAVRRFAGEEAMLPALVIGTAALHFIGVFAPASLDHHNVQVVLMLAMTACLLAPARNGAAAFGAGVAAALMLAVGMETAPHIAVACALVAAWFLGGGTDDRSRAVGFGLGLAGAAVLAFVLTVPPSRWFAVECDAFSMAQFSLAGLGGLGMALIASLRVAHRTVARRLVSLGLLGVLCTAWAASAFPQCLGDPFTSLDPRMKTQWLDLVIEAQPLWRIISENPGMVVARYVAPLIGLALALAAIVGKERRPSDVVVAVLLTASILVSVWQVRGTTIAIVLAVLPLSAWVGRVRVAATRHPGPAGALRLLGAWLVSFNLAWAATAVVIEVVLEGDAAKEKANMDKCTGKDDYAQLAALPATTVLAISNLGAPILSYTPHRALAGPYHRNVAGNLLVLDAFMGPLDQARSIAEKHGATIVAFCRGNPEGRSLSKWAPEGLISVLLRGETPAWLEIIPSTKGSALELYRLSAGS